MLKIITPDKKHTLKYTLVGSIFFIAYYSFLFRSYALNLYEGTLRKILNGNS